MTDTTQTLWRSAARFFTGTMLSRTTGLLRDMAMAYGFGTQSGIAAFLVAFRFAHLLRRLLGEGAMQTALIPYFEELRKEDSKRAGHFFIDLGFSLSIVLLILIGLIMGGIGLAIAYLPLSAGNAEILYLTLIMMPSLFFICLFGINAALLQCEKKYFISSCAPLFFNLFWIIGIFSTSHLETAAAMTNLSFFIILACCAQWVCTLPQTVCILKNFHVQHFFSEVHLFSKHVLKLTKPLALGIFGIAASQINSALDALFARWAADEGPAILWYALRLQQLPLALIGVALSGALLPPLARALENKNGAQFQKFLEFSLRNSTALMLPITAFFFVFGEPCVRLLFGHGDFSNQSVIDTTHALWGYAFGLIPMTLTLVLAPAFYANKNYRTPSLAAGFSMVLNALLNTAMITLFDLGATSVAVSTSVSAWFNFGWLALALTRKNRLPSLQLLTPQFLYFLFKTSMFSVLASLVAYFLRQGLGNSFLKETWHYPLYSSMQLCVELSFGLVIFSLFCLPLLVKDIKKQPNVE